MMKLTSGLAFFALLFTAANVVESQEINADVTVVEQPVAPYKSSSPWHVESFYESTSSSASDAPPNRASFWDDRKDGDYFIVEIYGLLRDNRAYERFLEKVYFEKEGVTARRCDMAMFRAVVSTERRAPSFDMFSFWYYGSGCQGTGDYKYCTGQYGGLGPNPSDSLVEAHIKVLKDGSFNRELRALDIDARDFGLRCCQFNQGSGGGGSSCGSLDKNCVKNGRTRDCKRWLEVDCLECFKFGEGSNKYKKCLKKTGQIWTYANGGYDYVCDSYARTERTLPLPGNDL